MGQKQPPDLVALRLWVKRLASDYEDLLLTKAASLGKKEQRAFRKTLIALDRTCEGLPQGPSKDRLRELLAGGLISYGIDQSELPEEALPEQVTVELATFALWPVIQAPKLSDRWFEDLQEITSAPLAELVAHARRAKSAGSPMSVYDFERHLVELPFSLGLLNLLEDLNDPRRGGPALTAIAIATSGTKAPHRGSPKVMVAWVLSAAAAGVVGNRADGGATALWDWLTDSALNGSGSSHAKNSNSDLDPFGSGSSGHHQQGNQRQPEGLIKFIEEFFHNL